MTDQVYLQKINGNPGFVDGATIPPFASKAALDASGSGWEIGTIANAAGVTYSWGGAGVGWAEAGGTSVKYSVPLLRFGPNRYIPSENVGGAIIDNNYLDDSGVLNPVGVYMVSKFITVKPGEVLAIAGAEAYLALLGCYYLDGVFVSPIAASWSVSNGYYNVPNGVNQVRINIGKTTFTGQKHIREVLPYANSLAATIGSSCHIGDSITRGAGTDVKWSQMACVQRLGAGAYTNLGIDGSTVAYTASYSPMSRRLSALVESDIITFMGGFNDKVQNIAIGTIADATDATFYGALNVIAKYMQENFPFSLIIWCTMYKSALGITANSNGATIMDFNAAIRAVANLYGFPVCDFEYNITNMTKYPSSRAMMSDNTHVARGGANLMANCLLSVAVNHM